MGLCLLFALSWLWRFPAELLLCVLSSAGLEFELLLQSFDGLQVLLRLVGFISQHARVLFAIVSGFLAFLLEL